MTKKFTLLQLFSLVDGRLSTSMNDVYEMLNHITDDNLFTHHLPVASNYVKLKNPKWFGEIKKYLSDMGIKKDTPFEVCLAKMETDNPTYDIPQLVSTAEEKQEFGKYMIDNSLLIQVAKKGKPVIVVDVTDKNKQ